MRDSRLVLQVEKRRDTAPVLRAHAVGAISRSRNTGGANAEIIVKNDRS